MISSQALQTSRVGKVMDFVSVPGCGIRCSMTNVESMFSATVTGQDISDKYSDIVSYPDSDETQAVVDGSGTGITTVQCQVDC